MRPQLRCDERTQEVAQVLLTTRLPGRLSQPVGRWMMVAGIDLLPDWAQQMLAIPINPLQRRTARVAVNGVARVLRASVRNGAYHCAMRRMATSSKIKNSHSMSAIFKAQSFAFIYYNSGYLF